MPKKKEGGDARNNWKRTSRTEVVPSGASTKAKSLTKNVKRSFQQAPNSCQGTTWEPRNKKGLPKTRKKPNLGVRVHPRSCQKGSKFDLLEAPKRLKMKRLNQEPKNKEVGYEMEAQERAFEVPKWTALGRM